MNIIKTIFKNCHLYLNNVTKDILRRNKEYPELCYALNIDTRDSNSNAKCKDPLSILKDIIDNGFLWGVPKSRRSLEKRMTRRMGYGKMILPKNNIVVCDTCGHFHPVHTVCGNCYETVKQETDVMKEAIMKELKLDPVDREVVVLYEDDPKDDKIFEGKRIVELPKERPQWFSKNLLVKDSQIPRQKPKAISSAIVPPTVTDSDK